LARIAKDIVKLCPNSTSLDSFDVYGGDNAKAQAEIAV